MHGLRYEYFCSIAGHTAMVAAITVTDPAITAAPSPAPSGSVIPGAVSVRVFGHDGIALSQGEAADGAWAAWDAQPDDGAWGGWDGAWGAQADGAWGAWNGTAHTTYAGTIALGDYDVERDDGAWGDWAGTVSATLRDTKYGNFDIVLDRGFT